MSYDSYLTANLWTIAVTKAADILYRLVAPPAVGESNDKFAPAVSNTYTPNAIRNDFNYWPGITYTYTTGLDDVSDGDTSLNRPYELWYDI